MGRYDFDHFFAVSERAPGRMLREVIGREVEPALPMLFELHDRVHRSQLDGTSGYGARDGAGRAPFESWRAAVEAVGRGSHWELYVAESYPDGALLERLRSEIARCLPRLPEVRHLIHTDLGGENLISDGVEITGVIDWANAMYGDFVYDYALLAFVAPWVEVAGPAERFCGERGYDVAYFDERLRCYQLVAGQIGLAFACLSERRWMYDDVVGWIERVL